MRQVTGTWEQLASGGLVREYGGSLHTGPFTDRAAAVRWYRTELELELVWEDAREDEVERARLQHYEMGEDTTT